MEYLIAIEPGTALTAWRAVVPDLPGCFSGGRTMEETLAKAREAVARHLDGLLDAGEAVPECRGFEVHRANPLFQGWVWAIVSLSEEELDDKVERINITIPRRVLRVIDNAAQSAGENRSAFLARAAMAQAARIIPTKVTGKAALYPELWQGEAFAAAHGLPPRDSMVTTPWSAKSAMDMASQGSKRGGKANP